MDKWEDTVIHAKGCTTSVGVIGATCNCGATNQAEISFKAGYLEGHNKGWNDGAKAGKDKGKQEGIQEMVDSFVVAGIHSNPHSKLKAFCKILNQWQAFLKRGGNEELPH